MNPEQKKAVHCVQGRLLILAGAGSGKTRVLTERMAYLIASCNVSPKAILGLTFTNKAAEEMRQRIERLISSDKAKEITLCTFHSFCMQVLREEIHHLGYTSQFSLYDEKDVERLVKMIARDLLEHEAELPSLSATMQAITQAKNRGVVPLKVETAGETWHEGFVREIYVRLQDSMRAYNAVDFDHLLTLTVDLFEKFPVVLERYQERFRYIMIDEYQDTNPVQFRLASLLSEKYHNLCVVGDDDQAIYGWRGAEVKNILEFDRSAVIKLEQNYRSTNTILKAANCVISHNHERHPKSLWSEKGKGNLIEVFVAPAEKEEAEAIAARVVKIKQQLGIPFKEIAVLYRSNSLSRAVEVALMRQSWLSHDKWITGVPYQVHGGTEFYERKEVKDLLAYMRAIINPLDQEALLRIINQPRRGIGEKALDLLTSQSRKNHTPLWEMFKRAANGEFENEFSLKALEGVRTFVQVMEEAAVRFDSGQLSDTLKWLIKTIRFEKVIEEDVKSDKMRAFKLENVDEFVETLRVYEKSSQGSLKEFISNMSLNVRAEIFNASSRFEDKVQMMTFHSAKGLEFEVCFLMGIEDQIIPHEKCLKNNGIEEERRLMYVALTRAKTHLILSMTKQRQRMGKQGSSRPSRFLFEIPKELIKPSAWHEV